MFSRFQNRPTKRAYNDHMSKCKRIYARTYGSISSAEQWSIDSTTQSSLFVVRDYGYTNMETYLRVTMIVKDNKEEL